jgi:hypothetical protein
MPEIGRNNTVIFADRTRKNLEFIENAHARNEHVHIVTQIAISLLGLIGFPHEKELDKKFNELPLADLVTAGWPEWSFPRGGSQNLGDLLWHLRNAVAHGRLSFSSDSSNPSDVFIEVADRPSKNQPPNWQARITAHDLRNFCLRFIEKLPQVAE